MKIPETLASGVARPRGRPRGPAVAIKAVTQQLGLHHFAFLRGVVQGLDPSECAARYLPLEERIDARTAKAMFRRLVADVATLAEAVDSAGLIRHSDALKSFHLDQRRGAPCSQDQSTGSSLEEFAEEFDPDMYSERELIELYAARHGAGASTWVDGSQQILRALNTLQGRLARHALADDTLVQWLPSKLAGLLRNLRMITLKDLATFISQSGRTWHRLVPGLGVTRANRISDWLRSQRGELELLLGPLSVPSAPVERSQCESSVALYGLVNLDQLFVPKPLDGRDGAFRGAGVNTLGAENDLQAIKAWLAQLCRNSKHTQVAYSREVERFYLWCVIERKKAMSSVDAGDCMDFMHFLEDPPTTWVQPLPYPRTHPAWRPFRGGLDRSSQARCLAAVSRLFNDLVRSGYLRTNPMPRATTSGTGAVRVDVMRSFSSQDQACIEMALARLPEGPARRRLRALVALLAGTGIRAGEVATHNMGSVIALRSPGIEDSGEALRIVGKGGKERIIPLRADILQALNEHHADLRVAVDKPVCPLPLIGVIGARPGHRDTPGGALSVNGMYDALKGLFAKAETLATHTAKADFHKASAHWLRHTFAHEVLAATEGDLATTKELLGHESINTTAIYVKAHMGQRQRAIRLLSGPCLSSMQEVPQPSDERQTATTPGSPLIRDSHGHLDNVATT